MQNLTLDNPTTLISLYGLDGGEALVVLCERGFGFKIPLYYRGRSSYSLDALGTHFSGRDFLDKYDIL